MKTKLYLLALVAIFALLLAGCQPTENVPTTAPEATDEPTEMVTEEPTEAITDEPTEVATEATEEASNLGTEENPLVFSFVPSTDAAQVIDNANKLVEALSEATGLVIEANVPTSYVGVIEAMCEGEAHIGALATFAYTVASARGCAEVALASIRDDSTSYQGQIVVAADSGIETVDQLAGKTFCRVSPVSASGWIIPSIELRAAGVDPDTDLLELVDSGAHDVVIRQVSSGDCDAGATFVDARDLVREEDPDIDNKVTVIATSAAIPNDSISFANNVPDDIRQQIVDAMLAIAEDEEQLTMLTDLYRWTGLATVNDSFYDEFRQYLETSGINVEDYIQ